MNSFFKIVLEQAKKESLHIKHPRYKMDDGYLLPDPGLFVNVLSPQSLVKYLANWLTCCPSWIEHVYDERPQPLPHAQSWHNFLISQHAQDLSNMQTSGKTSKLKAVTALLFQKEVPVLWALWAAPTNVHWCGKDIAISTLDNPPTDLARQIVYEICEQIF
jgi:hypothetical protein